MAKKKVGRNTNKCKAYQSAGTRERNKKRKLLKHVAWQPNDAVARKALNKL